MLVDHPDAVSGARIDGRLELRLTVLPAALVAVTVQFPVPVAVGVRLRLPFVPLPLAVTDDGAVQLTVALVALAVVQENVLAAPTVTDAGENVAAVIEGAANTVIDALPVAVVPAALAAVTVQLPAPAPLVDTERLPEVPELVPLLFRCTTLLPTSRSTSSTRTYLKYLRSRSSG